MTEATCDIGLIGLAVMGENLALNIASRGFVSLSTTEQQVLLMLLLQDEAIKSRLLAATHLKTLWLL